MIRSHTKLVGEGKKPKKYFCNLECQFFLDKTIKRVKIVENFDI